MTGGVLGVVQGQSGQYLWYKHFQGTRESRESEQCQDEEGGTVIHHAVSLSEPARRIAIHRSVLRHSGIPRAGRSQGARGEPLQGIPIRDRSISHLRSLAINRDKTLPRDMTL